MHECNPRLIAFTMGLIEPIILHLSCKVDVAEEACQDGKFNSKELLFLFQKKAFESASIKIRDIYLALKQMMLL